MRVRLPRTSHSHHRATAATGICVPSRARCSVATRSHSHRASTRSGEFPVQARVLPVIGAALAWAGREIVPHLADYVLDRLDRSLDGQRRTDTAQRSISNTVSRGKQGGGGRHRRRRRGA